MSEQLSSLFQESNKGRAAQFWLAAQPDCQNQPAGDSPVKVGFTSPAETQPGPWLDLHAHLVRHPLATFFVRLSGHALEGAHIYDGALLVIDRAEETRPGDLALAVVNGEFCVRRLELADGGARLCAANPNYPDLELAPDDQWEIWGRVIYSINRH